MVKMRDGRRSILVCLIFIAALWLSACDDDSESKATSDVPDTRVAIDAAQDTVSDVSADSVAGDVTDQSPDADVEPFEYVEEVGAGAEQQSIIDVPLDRVWQLEGLQDRVHVVFTELGVPHVYARNRNDLGRALGFLLARDRFFIMDLQRRLGQGKISTLLGDLALSNDIESRMIGMPLVTDRLWENLDDDTRAYLEAYAQGVNEYIRYAKEKELLAPSEYRAVSTLLGVFNPANLLEPFTGKDVAAMATTIMYETNFDTGDHGRNDRVGQLDGLFAGAPDEALRLLGAREDVWDRFAPVFDYTSAPSWGGSGKKSAGGEKSNDPVMSKGLEINKNLSRRAASRLKTLRARLGRDENDIFGSNTWAVAGSVTRDNETLVAGDGHLPLSVPALMYQVGMDTEVFGGDGLQQAGLLITSLPFLAVGTNGQIAWSQVNPVSDLTDWYLEELELDAEGRPSASLFQDTFRPLVAVDETYGIAEVRALGSDARDEVWTRWETFDGRRLYDIEGRELASAEDAAAGEYVVNLSGRLVVPGDADGDGAVQAISFDYTAFDATHYIETIIDMGEATNVGEYQEATKGLIGNMLYSAVGDMNGDILFTSYQAVPCRGYLPKEGDGWAQGADPTMLLDGNLYGAFTIPSLPDGKVDESQASDPYRCVVPFDETPQSTSPAGGYVVNANNQPAPIQFDSSFANDPWYIGGPWYSVRGDSISRGIEAAIASDTADVAAMAAIQGDSTSRLGEIFSPVLLDSVDLARALLASPDPLTADETRLVALYQSRSAEIDEVYSRLSAWRGEGYPADSGVETFYHQPTAIQRENSVATMLFNAWLPRAIDATFGDESMDAAWRFSGNYSRWHALRRFLLGRGAGNPEGLSSWIAGRDESVFFDDIRTAGVTEGSDEVLLMALIESLDDLSAAPSGPGEGGFGTAVMSEWLWGLRHQVKFESLVSGLLPPDSGLSSILDSFSITTRVLPLAESFEDGDPRADLKWFPRPGDNYGVDAANPGLSGTDYTHSNGPVMRMVIALKDGRVSGQNIVPGGQSGLSDSPHYADQAEKWLANETVKFRYHTDDVIEGAERREVLFPR